MTTSILVSSLRSRGTLTAIALVGLIVAASGSSPRAQPDPGRLAMVKAMTFQAPPDRFPLPGGFGSKSMQYV